MLYGAYKINGEIKGGFYYEPLGYEKWYEDTWSPDTEVIGTVDFTVHGSNYSERKEDVRNKAIEYQNLFSEGVSFYYGELAIFGDYFATQGKRYGLSREFAKNGIC